MTITYSLPGFRLISQLSEPTQDTYPDENARNNCVVASLSMALDYLTGGNYDGDELKDAVYGQGYIGPMSAAKYEAYCAARGVTLAPHDGSQSDLIATIHAQVDAGHPVLVTMPSQWGTPYPDPVHPSGSTHVGVAYGTGPGMLRIGNPWGGFAQDESDAWWQARLCYGQVWPMQKASGSMWHQVSASPLVMADSNGVKAQFGMAAYLAAHPTLGDVVKGCGGETYDSDHSILPLEGEVSLVYLKSDNTVHSDKSGEVLWSLHQQVAAANAATQSAQSAESSAQASLSAANAQIAQLQQQIATLQRQPAPTPPAPVSNPAPTTPADAAVLLVSLIYAEAQATLKAVTPA